MLKQLLHRVKNKAGITLVEMILYVVTSGIIFGVTSQVLLSHISAYDFMAGNQSTVSDVRYALTRMSTELLRITSDHVISIDDNSISFVDQDNVITGYSKGISDGRMALLRGNEPLISSISTFNITGFDINDQPTTTVSSIRKYKVTLITAPLGAEGSRTLSTTVTPREYIYASYQ
jgi:hypothetical protein